MHYTKKDVKTLAIAFATVIRTWLTPEQLKDVNRENIADDMTDEICNSHEYIDANFAMITAFNTIYSREINMQGLGTDFPLITAAWGMAKKSGFLIGLTGTTLRDKQIDFLSDFGNDWDNRIDEDREAMPDILKAFCKIHSVALLSADELINELSKTHR